MTMVIEQYGTTAAPTPAVGGPPGTRWSPWCIDTIRPTDGPALTALFESCSTDTVWRRFFAPLHELPADYAAAVLACRPEVHDAVVVRHGDRGHLAGLASLAAEQDGPNGTRGPHGPDGPAVLGVLVADAWQRQGLGGAMLDVLLDRARQRGVRRVTASVLPGRARLLAALARRLETESASRDQDGLTGVYRLGPLGGR
ncbi:GNAT family N-acetyltransferase [Streptomyces monticola]|uniref:GNAT family N-acetyltransferase n=1 Tax=Streptomyces monticola TaxID=2666263 RepID=A0ABW2JEA4_9ACTN